MLYLHQHLYSSGIYIFYKTHQPISLRQGFTCWITADTAKRYSNANALDYDNNWRISTSKDRTAYIKYILTKLDAKKWSTDLTSLAATNLSDQMLQVRTELANSNDRLGLMRSTLQHSTQCKVTVTSLPSTS